MVERDLDDTVIGPPRPLTAGEVGDDSDTIVRERLRSGPPSATGPDAADNRAGSLGPVEPRVLYGFRVNTSEVISLERPAYIGRNPSHPRVLDGVRPRLVRVPSALGEVSGTHVELRQQGPVVIATDLRSTNGTRVNIPGSPPVRLRQSESIVVSPGSVIEIGDDNVIEVLAMRRAQPFDETPGAAHS